MCTHTQELERAHAIIADALDAIRNRKRDGFVQRGGSEGGEAGEGGVGGGVNEGGGGGEDDSISKNSGNVGNSERQEFVLLLKQA